MFDTLLHKHRRSPTAPAWTALFKSTRNSVLDANVHEDGWFIILLFTDILSEAAL